MSFVICKHPAARMDIMALEQYWPQIVSFMERTHVQYEKEEHVVPEGSTDKYVVIRDLKGHCPVGGDNLGEFLGLLHAYEKEVTGKFYIMISPRKRGKKDDESGKETRQKAGPGSEGGN